MSSKRHYDHIVDEYSEGTLWWIEGLGRFVYKFRNNDEEVEFRNRPKYSQIQKLEEEYRSLPSFMKLPI